MKNLKSLLLSLMLLALFCPRVRAQVDVPKEAAPVPGDSQLVRLENRIYRSQLNSDQFPVKIPKFCAPVRGARWIQGTQSIPLDLTPEINHWNLSTKQSLTGQGTLVVEFDALALLPHELPLNQATADGSIWLPAHAATTNGEKLRYEPQPHKNTVGYWTQAGDFATWKFRVEKPGKFNLAILQGCGAGQGGSRAVVDLLDSAGKSVGQVEFDVLETGHFQNFQWIQLSTVEVKEPGEYQLKVSPKQIRKNALMDIRAVHLIRLPG